MNFANDTTHITSNRNYWIAVIFHSSASGTVSRSNFFECKSFITNPTQPSGKYENCIFTNCRNYYINLLPSGNNNGTPSDFGFPLKCAAEIMKNRQERGDSILNTVLIYFTLLGMISKNPKYCMHRDMGMMGQLSTSKIL